MPEGSFSIDSVVGRNARMRAIVDFVRVIAPGDSSVLVTGETGTGKELIANLIHHLSGRRHAPFVPVSCAILTESLIEAELFGHERGAFTGAVRDREGRFELANRGTIFLDDVDDVPMSIQVKLLRVLQNRTIERVGGSRQIPVDVRVITGAKRDLRQLVAEGKFREDLYYRLNVIAITLPPLRDRRDDIPLLTDHFLGKYFRARGEGPKPLSPTVRRAFNSYRWPGNVRELENSCERIAQTCGCDLVRVGCLPASVLFGIPPATAGPSIENRADPIGLSLDDRLQDVESRLIAWALSVTHGNQSHAAQLLTIKRSTLGDRIRKLGLRHGTSG